MRTFRNNRLFAATAIALSLTLLSSTVFAASEHGTFTRAAMAAFAAVRDAEIIRPGTMTSAEQLDALGQLQKARLLRPSERAVIAELASGETDDARFVAERLLADAELSPLASVIALGLLEATEPDAQASTTPNDVLGGMLEGALAGAGAGFAIGSLTVIGGAIGGTIGAVAGAIWGGLNAIFGGGRGGEGEGEGEGEGGEGEGEGGGGEGGE